jgi:hypothetical protein
MRIGAVDEVLVERARLAIVDPVGEWEAVDRLDRDRARSILRRAALRPIATRRAASRPFLNMR